MRDPAAKCLLLLPLLMVAATGSSNDRPVIGLLFQRTDTRFAPQYGQTYIERAYIDYIESAGALTVPIRVDEPDEYYVDLMSKINGVLFPGGGVSLVKSGYAKAGHRIAELAIKANDRGEFFPLWGTCLGSELLMTIAARDAPVYSKCSAENVMLALKPVADARSSRLLSHMPPNLLHIVTNYNVTANYHNMCLEPKTYKNNSDLNRFYRVISTNYDVNGLEFVSMFEGKNYPFYATQWHPEKNMYIWAPDHHLNHSRGAVRVAQYFANFFVNEARKSHNKYPDNETLSKELFYNLPTVYLGLPTMLVNYYLNLTDSAPGADDNCQSDWLPCSVDLFVVERLSWFLMGVIATTLLHYMLRVRNRRKRQQQQQRQEAVWHHTLAEKGSVDQQLNLALAVDWNDDMKQPLHKAAKF